MSPIRRLTRSLYRRGWRQTVGLASEKVGRWGGRHLLRIEARHLFGPVDIAQGPGDLIATCVVRNGALHVRSFIEHHLALGIKHIVFLDNGSVDETVDLIREYSGVTVLRTRLPYRRFENAMKEYLTRRFCNGRWNLCLDIDELWCYPFMHLQPLDAFLRYLDGHGFDTVVCQMLDMFSDVPFSQLGSSPDDNLRRKYPWYDRTQIEQAPYRFGVSAHPSIHKHHGGIRMRLFGTNNGLTKAALVRVSPHMELFVETHFNTPAHNADVTCVLLHYPFVDRFPAKVAEAVESGRYLQSAHGEYVAYLRVLLQSPEPRVYSVTATRFTSVEALIDQGFLVVSDRYREWALAGGTATGGV